MKAFNLMKLAQENPQKYEGKKYKYIRGAIPIDSNSRQSKEFYISEYGEFLVEGRCLKLFITDTTEVEEMQQPVDFLTAVKAYSEGKTIRVETPVNGTTQKYVYKLNKSESDWGHGYLLSTKSGTAITTKEILEGKWHVEDSDE